jgi:acyl-CoA dehydrogenase
MTLILLGAALVWALAYFRANLSTWTGAFVFLIGIWTFVLGGFIDGLAWLVWMVFLAAAAIANIPLLRRTLLVKPFLCRFRRMTPSLSRTEREALEAGTVWWDGELFTGNPNWNKLLAIPQPKLTDEELSFLDGPVEELCRMLDDWKIVADTKDLPQEVWQFIRKQRFFGMIIPKEYGGMGFSTYAHSQVITKIAGRSVTAAITVMVPNSLGPAELLLH